MKNKLKSLGTVLTIITGLMLVISILIVIVSTILLARNHSDTIMQDKSESSLSILKHELNNELDRLGKINTYMESSNIAGNLLMTSITDDIVNAWTVHSSRQGDFMALYKKDGTLVWNTENFALSEAKLDLAASGNAVSGVVNDAAMGLTLQYITPVRMYDTVVGTAIIGMSLAETDYLDDIKTLTGAEVTIFQGNTRFATTVINTDGNRATGTTMAANVEKRVITDGKVYQGTADILGQNHFVDYEPMLDISGNIIGAYFAGFSSAEDDQSFFMMIIIAAGIAIVATLISGIILAMVIRNKIAKPIAIAEDLAQNMSAGNLSIPNSTYKFSDDEIGRFVINLENTKHTLNSYIDDISRILSEMSEGDFTATTTVDYIGDFTTIKTSFAKIKQTLYGIISNMNSSADDVMTGANQIADGSQMLAEGTTRQATAIDELSASIDSISEKVQNTANNAEEANKLSEDSRTKISQQNEEMETMLSAMEEIRTKSVQISDIIKTIDDIAFQTNILALNAAIEAARAGAAGKGFAVVADEVRNLAAKSAEAANNTTELISATVEAVTNGVQIAQNTAETMKEVMEYSEKTDVLIGEIYTAAAEQAEAVRQVTIGIGQISDVVQQNSATAEQTAASCEELSGQSRMLKEQVDLLHV